MSALTVLEQDQLLSFTYADLLKYHGTQFPGGVAHGFKVMERAFPLLASAATLQRLEVGIATAFPGPGARDAFEMVTRAVTGGRYQVDLGLAGPTTLASPKGFYLFLVSYRGRTAEVTLRPGHVRDEFLTLARNLLRTPAEEVRLAQLKQEMADHLLSLPALELYDATLSEA